MTPRPHSASSGNVRRPSRPKQRHSGSDQDLINEAIRIDSRPYGFYGDLLGDWDYGDFILHIDRIQADPYAPPSALRVTASTSAMGLPEYALSTADQRTATADYLVRAFSKAIARNCPSRALQVARTGQEILERSACTVTPQHVEIRFQLQLPARGRTIMGREAGRLFDVDLPDTVMDTLDFVSEEAADHLAGLTAHVHAYEDYRALSQSLTEQQWVAFVADGAVLARRSGVSELPLTDAVPFESPESLTASVTLPHAGTVRGMAIPPGVTVIAGGGYHGKSTLLNAIQRGVYAHVPGDGRELVATTEAAMKIRAADGRAVTAVDVSAFISHLPGGADTSRFSTENASGSTSQAASIMEAVEAGSPLLLLDEDTSATNLLIRDTRMRALIAAEKEPITPLVDRIGALFAERAVSTILVMGGSGDYLDVADTVLMLDEYHCLDVTARARSISTELPRELTALSDFPASPGRVPVRSRGGGDKPKTKASGLDTIIIDKTTVDVSDIEQIVDSGQTEAIAWMLRGLLEEYADARTPLAELLVRLERTVNSEGLDAVIKFGARPYPAFLVRPRPVDLAAAINRYRVLKIA
ncbi:ABC-ATPase domain-containing protein [Schaalia sp. Marseille-Q2122]|uniref:ABC-ATPase domain-containing protein n=1 Tax=Schaalia sp. Marseille-Q2122 TaxID=2736604 RepID=UPI001589B802|nr:ABC-ATPase domain-containing protein [Schaalia sp. Marseille-Q2122]